MRENPLFVDSTKTRGDNINACFELKNLVIRENERIILKIVEDPQNRQHEIQMRSKDELWMTRVFLQHKNKIKFQFVVINETKTVVCSPIYDNLVNYLIETDWEHSTNMNLLFNKKEASEQQSKGYQDFQENKTILGNLIKQWGL